MELVNRSLPSAHAAFGVPERLQPDSTLCWPCYNQAHRAVDRSLPQGSSLCKNHGLTPSICAGLALKEGRMPCSQRIMRSAIKMVLKTDLNEDGTETPTCPPPLLPVLDTCNMALEHCFPDTILSRAQVEAFFSNRKFRNFQWAVRYSHRAKEVSSFIDSHPAPVTSPPT